MALPKYFTVIFSSFIKLLKTNEKLYQNVFTEIYPKIFLYTILGTSKKSSRSLNILPSDGFARQLRRNVLHHVFFYFLWFHWRFWLMPLISEMCPKDPTNFNNRSACYMMMEQYDNAVTDANKVIQLDPSCVKVFYFKKFILFPFLYILCNNIG